MFDRSQIVVGLEIGTTKVCAAVGELAKGGSCCVIGLGTAPTEGGVCKGEIVNADLVENAVRLALTQAENESDIEIGSVYLGVTGSHIRGLNKRGVHPVSPVGGEIDSEDIRQVVSAARPAIALEEEVLHTVRQYFRVDGQDDVKNPVGRVASRLELDVHVVCGQRTRIQNPVRLVKGLGIEVEDIAFNGRVMGLPLLTPQICEQGALIIDLGAGTTEYAVYLNGSLSHCGVLPIGGDHVTNDLAVGLKLTQSKAERLKVSHGSAVYDPCLESRMVNFSSDIGLDDKQIYVGDLHRIMHARLDELFQLIYADLNRNSLLRRINGGLLLLGGVARTSQIDLLAQKIFGLDILTNSVPEADTVHDFLTCPEYVTAIGLAKHGARQTSSSRRKKRNLFGWLTGR